MSLDVVSLFRKVPTDETLVVVRDKLAADPWLEERIYIPIDNLMEMLTFNIKQKPLVAILMHFKKKWLVWDTTSIATTTQSA